MLNDITQLSANRIGETDMRNDTVSKEGRYPRFRAVVKLLRKNNVQGTEILSKRSDRARGKNPFHTELFESVYVCAEIDFRRGDCMIAIMAGQKCDPSAF